MIYTLQDRDSSLERNKQILEKFIHSMKSEITQVNSIDYLNAFMRYWRLYKEEEEEPPLSDDDGQGGKKGKKQKQRRGGKKELVYRYDWLLDEARKGGDDDSDDDDGIQTLQDKIIQFVIYKKNEGIGANGIGNYISPLR